MRFGIDFGTIFEGLGTSKMRKNVGGLHYFCFSAFARKDVVLEPFWIRLGEGFGIFLRDFGSILRLSNISGAFGILDS